MKVTIGEGRRPTEQTSMAALLRTMEAPAEAPLEPGPAPAAPPPPPAAAPGPDPNDIGVVFVHGIGSQQPGETLLSWSRPLIRLVAAWRATTHGVQPLADPNLKANIDFSGGSQPFIVLDVPRIGSHPAQRWHLTEAWWASHVSPPGVGAMFRWLVPGEMVRLTRRITGGLASEGSQLFRAMDRVFLPLFLVPATALVILLYAVFRVMQLVPVEKIREFAAVKAIEFFLVDWFGDVRVLLADRTQAANIRGRVADAIRDCQAAGCGTIVLVGHSGGTIVGYMTLTDPAYRDLPVRTFITHGQALGMAWRLGHVDADADEADRRPDRLYRGDRLRTDLSKVDFRTDLAWHDFWATHDPAPAGGFEADAWVSRPEDVRGRSRRVFNRMSLRNDHGGYWDNDEEFVLPVARLIDLAPGDRAESRFFPERDQAPDTDRVARRQERVKLLQLAWVSVMVSAAVAAPLAIIDQLSPTGQGSIARLGSEAWQLVGAVLQLLNPILGFFDVVIEPFAPLDTTWAVVVGVAVLLFAYWFVGRAMSSLWTRWDDRERTIALQPLPAWRSPRPLVAQLVLCAGAAIWLLTFAVTGSLLLAAPSAALLLAAVGVAAGTSRGRIRRPARSELEAAGIDVSGQGPAGDGTPAAGPAPAVTRSRA